MRVQLKNHVRESCVFEFLILKSIFHEKQKKNMSYFKLKASEEIVKKSSLSCEDYKRLNTTCKSITDLLFVL